tara:strand:+ start:546 stop:1199 length:654 start_codon:yes stop_codon:yes gene_type:complete
MNIIFLILARSGSVRIKNKNLQKIKNKTLVAHAIEFAKKISPLKNIIVSTDSNKIKKIGLKYGLDIKKLRPTEISKSKTSSYVSAKYEINQFEKHQFAVDIVVLLQPTSPFRSLKTYKKSLKKFLKYPNIPLITVKKIYPKYNYYKNRKSKLLRIIKNHRNSQIYEPNGNLFIISKKTLMREKNFFSKKMNFHVIDDIKENIDIDTQKDLLLARNLS